MQHACKWMKSPVGQLKLVASEAGLSAILWEKDGRSWKHLRSQQADTRDHPILLETEISSRNTSRDPVGISR